MNYSSVPSILQRAARRHPTALYSAVWSAALWATVAVASLAAEVAFVSATSPSSSFSKICRSKGFVRVPLDVPGEALCLPARFFTNSYLDFVVPSLSGALVVAASAFAVRGMGLVGRRDRAGSAEE